MQFPIDRGGLKIPCLEMKDKALKLPWFPCLIHGMDQLWYLHLNSKLTSPVETLLQKNLSWKDFKDHMKPGLPEFWYDFFHFWTQLNFQHADSIYGFDKIAPQSLWFNSNIKIATKPVQADYLQSAGISLITHLLSTKGGWISPTEVSQKYGVKMSGEQLHWLWNAIPQHWKGVLQKAPHVNISTDTLFDRAIDINSRFTKFFYDEMLKKETSQIPAAVK